MAELVDAADSKSAVRKDVQVRFLFWALPKDSNNLSLFYLHTDTLLSSLLFLQHHYNNPCTPEKKPSVISYLLCYMWFKVKKTIFNSGFRMPDLLTNGLFL